MATPYDRTVKFATLNLAQRRRDAETHRRREVELPANLCALAIDHCFAAVGLHRVEVNIRPENTASLRVVEKLGFRQESNHERYLHIDGEWRDHLGFALTADDVPEGLVAVWRARQTT